MTKIRYVYRAYTRDDLKLRSSVPDQIDITTVDGSTDYIACNNIDRNKIRSIIGETSDGLAQLCINPSINPWSGFGPTKREIIDGVLTNRVPIDVEGYELDSFAGYNHEAIPPYYINKGSATEWYYNSNASHTFRCRINIGEVRYTEDDIIHLNNNVSHIAFSVWKGTNCIGYVVKPISVIKDILDFDTESVDRITVSNITETTIFTCKIWFLNSPTWDYTGENLVCQVPGLEDWTETIYIRSANHFYLNGPENDSTKHGSTFTSGKWDINNASFNTTNGTMMVYYVKLNTLLTGSYNHLHVRAWVETGYFDQDDIWIGNAVTTPYDHLYDGSWNQNLNEAFQVIVPLDIWNIPDAIITSGYGYRIVIDCNPSTI